MTDAPAPNDHAWTASQRQAIETRDVSVSLSAGAGCGKTFVLTQRYLGYFKPDDPDALRPEDLHRLVAITFTDRAAREMRQRVRLECYRKLESAEGSAAQYWSAVVRGLDNARMSTIHSFCASLLRTHAVEAGLDPQFDVLEQAQSETLLSEAVDDELRKLVAQRRRATVDLAAEFDLHALQEIVRRLAVEARNDQIDRWPPDAASRQLDAWEAFFRGCVVPLVARRVFDSPPARQVVATLREHVPNHPAMQSRRDALLEILSRPDGDGPADAESLAADLQTIHEQARVQGGGGAKAWPNDEVYATFRDAATQLRTLIDKVAPTLAFAPPSARRAAEVGLQLLAIAAGVRRRYADRKRELAALDFDDLLVRARALLVDPDHGPLRRRLSSQIQLLLVDEFQDTDRMQLELVQALCGQEGAGGKLFFVGDYKQSIYRFRGAEPDVFRDLREATPQRGRLSLSKNFRSQPAILEFVNALFWHDLGTEYEPLRAHRRQLTPTPAVEFLWTPTPPDAAARDVKALRRHEADWIARRIRAMLDGDEPLVCEPDPEHPGQQRPRAARPGDVAILFRALSDVELYEDALRRHGIDYYLVGGHAFYAQQEVFDLLNLLRAIASPTDSVSLAGALRSPLFALSDESLFWLAQHPDGLTAGLFAPRMPDGISGEQRRRVAHAAGTILKLRDCKDRLRICELIELAMSLTGYDATLLAEFLGERKLANLRKVIEQARSFERGGSFGLVDFVFELSQYVARQPKEPLAATLSEDTDIVRLMTIHQAKGLEFPIVVVADLNRSTDHRTERVHFDEELGPLVQMPEDAGGDRSPSGFDLWRVVEQEADLAELHRLLYVATTRAADYLMLSSGVADLGNAKGTWMQLLARRFDLLSGQLIAPLPEDEPRPKIRVTTQQPTQGSGGASRRRADLQGVIAEAPWSEALPTVAEPAIEPVPIDAGARRQYSFSRLTGTLHPRSATVDDDARPAPAVDPLELGTLVHSVLSVIDFADVGDWRAWVELHADRRLLPEGSAEAREAALLVEQFLASPRAAALASAERTLSEAEFLLAWPPGEAAEAPLFLTGYIDQLYQDDQGRWCVLDFKTNQVTPGNLAEVASRYEMQMLVYALAAEQILGTPPASLTLHFLRSGAERQFAWDDAARQRVTALVDEAITAARAAPP